MVANTDRQREPYTGFGRTMRRFMAERGINSWTHLEDLIKEKTGNKRSHQNMSKYAFGDVQTPYEFVHDFADALGLDEAERRELAWKYTYESRPE